jgi:hypothetical protein
MDGLLPNLGTNYTRLENVEGMQTTNTSGAI